MQKVLTQVIRAPGLAPYLAHYTAGSIYFRLLPTTHSTPQDLRRFQSLKLQVGQQPPLCYDEKKDTRRYPVLVFRFVYLTATAAEVWVEVDREGVIGKFTLAKKLYWTIQTADVYET
ncbi:hypothetical protein GO988_22990 [Hymenobacter sp. HMF4947]|uniref:Uncharacterized protein n=1 Tax=Hymenobacter ginkgonis TaxID=2682976 RepID=A0A7K1TLB2_9BACT|nr:hypothetical protein [Hymenobacter ginkgonis]MVN79208.1 hypothetical protein [Hymenobacter ginkgonis]